MEPCLESRFVKFLNRTAFCREEAKPHTNTDEKESLEKVKSIKKEINNAGSIKKPNNHITKKTIKQTYNDYRHKQEVINTTNYNISEENLKNTINVCSDSNKDYEYNNSDKRTVSELNYVKEFTNFCDWLANCVTEENCLIPEDLIVYNELKKEGKVVELDETWKIYYEQPIDALKLLEEADFLKVDTEIENLNQHLEDMIYIRNQLRCELQNIGQAIEDMKRTKNCAKFQLCEHVKQCMSHCEESSISLEQLISEIESVEQSLQFLATYLDSSNTECSGESFVNIISTSSKYDVEKSMCCKQGKASEQNYVFQTSLRKYEAACSLFGRRSEAVFCNFTDEMLCDVQCEDSKNYRFHVTEDSDLHEFCRLELSLTNSVFEHTQLTCKEKALKSVIKELQLLMEDMKTGNFELSPLKIGMKLAGVQELANLKNENETFDDELCKVCTIWVKQHIKFTLFGSTCSKRLAACINDITIEKLLDTMFKVKATGDILSVMCLIDNNFITAAVKLIINIKNSLLKFIPALQEYKVVLEYNYAHHHTSENSELLNRVADALGSDVNEIENKLKIVSSSNSDQLKLLLLMFSQQYNKLNDIENQLNKWWISVCDHCIWKSVQCYVDRINVCEDQILEKLQFRLEKLGKCLYENQGKIIQNEENRMKKLKWILFLIKNRMGKKVCVA